ncbi:MAG TPA: GMC family oxidoreductase [Gemmatimonadales bacterium]|nr:GMC family oxidoreductase [Gemmatimonadales bacterium]
MTGRDGRTGRRAGGQEPPDVVIIGSGAGGGMAAYMLTRAGARVTVIEAGPLWWPDENSDMWKWNYESMRRGSSTRTRPFGEFDAGDGGWDIPGEPYTVAEGSKFGWYRGRLLGGRTNHWGRISLRFGPLDFRRKSIDGLGDDWPISYDDVKPYYDQVDQLIGIFGSPEGLPNEPDGIFLPPPEPRCWEKVIQKSAKGLGMTIIPSRLSILTRPLNGRPACHYCGQCNRGCRANANFSSPGVLLRPAMATGRLTIIPNAMAREITTLPDGRARGVSYIDKAAGREMEIRARVVVVAASACESARLLLNSKSSRHPNGLSNSSGVLGKYLTDTVGTGIGAFVPSLMNGKPHNCDGVGGAHLYFPWVMDNRKLGFPRGYHIEIWGGRGMPRAGAMGGMQDRPIGGGYGASLKAAARSYYGAFIGFDGRGEQIPTEHCFCEIDPKVVDQWGIPVLRFHWKWADWEINQAKHMQKTFAELIDAMGGTPTWKVDEDTAGIEDGGVIIHELGTVRMGNDPGKSAVNRFCQAHEAKNVFVTDGGPFVSQADKNPTWTILALSMRTSEYIAEQMKANAL